MILLFDKTEYEQVMPGVKRKITHTENLMSVLIDFTKSEMEEKMPYHSHVHEQISYVATGEIVFCCEGEPDTLLKEGDFFSVPSNKQHTIEVISEHARLIDSFNPIRKDFLEEK